MKIEWVPRSTPFPNILLDEVLPRLRDTEWRLLCVVVRQTLGWVDPRTGQRKRTDWISQSQLKRKTGRASAAISQAIDVLVRANLIEVTDSAGRRLASTAVRRRSVGGLRLGLSRDLRNRLLQP